MSISSTEVSWRRTAERWWKAAVTREFGEQGGGLLGGAALLDLEGVRALLVEAQRVDAVHDELAGEVLAQRLQGLGVALPRHRDDDDVAAAGAFGVVGALDAEAQFPRGGLGAVGGPGADDHLLARPGEPVGEAAALVAGAAEDADNEAGDVGEVPGVLGRRLLGAV